MIVPGDHGKSVIWNRAAAANGFTRMPPLASSEIDQVGIDLLREWIDGTLPENQTYNQWRLERFGSLVSAEGEPGEDPDGDGRDNRHEFLTRTDPESGASLWNPGLVVNDTWLSFQNLENRSIRVESSTNLLDWKLWDQPGNDGLPVSGPTRNYPRDPADPGRFFKFRIEKP